MLLSEYIKLDSKLDEYGVFDPIIDKDSHFFINIQRLKKTDVPEFITSYDKIRSFFCKIIKLLSKASTPSDNDTYYKQAIHLFHFPEVNGIRLGHSKSGRGAGFGVLIEKDVIRTAYDIVKAGIDDPEFFELIPLFQKNVGPDRLSDMIAQLILVDIESYTKRIYSILGINTHNYPNNTFTSEGIMKINNNLVLLVPTQILHKLPIAERWSDISIVMSENNAIRSEINYFVANEWERYTTSQKKEEIRKAIFLDPESFARIVEVYKAEELDQVNISSDFDYFLAKLFKKGNVSIHEWKTSTHYTDTLESTMDFFHHFQFWVEFNGGWEVIKSLPSKNKEKMIQRIIHGYFIVFIECNNLDISCEPNEGIGPCDFKISRGMDCTVAELKLSSNAQYLHGLKKQLPLYAKSEKTNNMVYVFVDIGNRGRVDNIQKLHDRMIDEGSSVPELIIIDAKDKDSASHA